MGTQVEDTNSYSTLSKCSMIQKGYINDKFISCFCKKNIKRSPLINIGYYIRTKIINYIGETFARNIQGQIVSFGAGFDTLYFRLLEEQLINKEFKYFEIDLKDVVKQKLDYIENTPILSEKLGKNYYLIEADLKNIKNLESLLTNLQIDYSLPTLLLAECSIIYMNSSSSRVLIEWSAKKFPNAALVVYEQVYPSTAFGHIMKNHFETLGTPLHSFSENVNLCQQANRYTKAGWPRSISHTKWNVFLGITTKEEQKLAFSRELFDEWEEIHILCSHYSLTIASQGSLNESHLLPDIPLSNEENEFQCLKARVIPTFPKLQRFGHSVCHMGSGRLFLCGGFGPHEEKFYHERSKTAFILKNMHWHSLQMPPSCALMHSQCVWDERGDKVYLLGGRQSPSKASRFIYYFNQDKGIVESIESSIMSRWRFSAVLVSHSSGSGCLIYGGIKPGLQILDDCFLLLFDNLSEPHKLADGPGPRFSHSAASDPLKMVVWLFGGLDTSFSPLKDLWRYNVNENKWTSIEIEGPYPLPRHGHSSLVTSCGKRLVLVGGANWEPGIRQPDVTIINLESYTCFEYKLPATLEIPAHPSLLLGIAICPLSLIDSSKSEENDEICIIAGGANCFSFGTHFNNTLISFKLPSNHNQEENKCEK